MWYRKTVLFVFGSHLMMLKSKLKCKLHVQYRRYNHLIIKVRMHGMISQKWKENLCYLSEYFDYQSLIFVLVLPVQTEVFYFELLSEKGVGRMGQGRLKQR